MKRNLVLILLLFFAHSFLAQEYKVNVAKYCSTINIKDWQMTDEERITKREESKAMISGSLGSMIDFLNDQSYGSLISGALLYMILFMLILLGSVVTTILFLIFCCCFKKGEKNFKRSKIYWYVGAVMILLYLIFLILFLVYFTKVKNKSNEINCAVSKLADGMFDGVKNDYYSYLGINSLTQLLETFNIEVEQIKDITDEFDQIFNLLLNEKGNLPIQALTDFYTQYQGRKILDPLGIEQIPFTITDLEESKNKIEEEFVKFQTIAQKVQLAALVGKSISTTDKVTQIKEKLTSSVEFIKNLKNITFTPLNKISESVSTTSEDLSAFYGSGFALSIVNFVICMISCIGVWNQWRKRRCFQMTPIIKFLLILASLISIYLAYIGLYSVIVASSIQSLCSEIGNVLVNSTPGGILSSAGLILDETTTSYANKCIPEDSSGSFYELISSADFNTTEQLLDGLTVFQNFKKNLTALPENSETITNITSNWTLYQNGFFYSFENVKTEIDKLNKELSCEDQEMHFNQLNCTLNSNLKCLIISEVIIPYNAPNCVENVAETSDQFNKLRDYYLSSFDLHSKMKENLIGETETTPNFKYKELVSGFNQAMGFQD